MHHPMYIQHASCTTPQRAFFALSLWLNGWSRNILCVILLTDIMDLHMSIFGTLLPKWPSCVFYALKCQGVKVFYAEDNAAFW